MILGYNWFVICCFCWMQHLQRRPLSVGWSPASLVPGRERVNPSIPLPSLKLFSAQQCAHACHAVLVFFREVTFHLYLKTPDACQSLSLLLPHTLSCLWARLWNMHLLKHIEARWLVPLTTWSHVGELVNQLLSQLCTSEAFSSLLPVWVHLVKCSFSCTCAIHGWNKQDVDHCCFSVANQSTLCGLRSIYMFGVSPPVGSCGSPVCTCPTGLLLSKVLPVVKLRVGTVGI